MKTHILLFLIRWHLASDNPLPPWLERACRRSTVLATARDEEQRLTTGLRATPPSPQSGISPQFEGRLLRTLRTTPAVQTRGFNRPSPALIGGGLLAAAALTIAVIHTRSIPATSEDPATTTVALSPPPIDDAAPSIDVAQAKTLRPGDFGPGALERELQYVLADAKGALRFLASNFLPSDLLPATAEEEDGQG